MRVTYDAEDDAAYISLTDKDIIDIRQNLECPTPRGVPGEVIMDWKDGRLIGVEVLGASDPTCHRSVQQSRMPGFVPPMSPRAVDPLTRVNVPRWRPGR